jgi:hypothetical protein
MIMRLFAYMGGALIFAGLSVFIETIWEDIGSLSRVIITLGTGFVAYICGIVFALDKRFEKAATPAFILAFIMQPMGLFVLLDEYFPGDNPALGGMVVFAPLAIQQLLTFMRFRFSSLLLYSLLYILGFAFSFVEYFDIDRGFASLALGTFLLLTTINMQIKDKFKDLTPLFFVIATILFFAGVYYYVGRTTFDPLALSLIFALLGFAVIKETKTLYVMCMLYMSAYFIGGPGGGGYNLDWHVYNQLTAIFTGTSLVLAGQWLRERTNYISLFPPVDVCRHRLRAGRFLRRDARRARAGRDRGFGAGYLRRVATQEPRSAGRCRAVDDQFHHQVQRRAFRQYNCVARDADFLRHSGSCIRLRVRAAVGPHQGERVMSSERKTESARPYEPTVCFGPPVPGADRFTGRGAEEREAAGEACRGP